MLEEKNYFEQQLESTRANLNMVEGDLSELQKIAYEQSSIYADILNIRTMKSDKNIEHAMRNLAADCKRFSNDIVDLRDQLMNC